MKMQFQGGALSAGPGLVGIVLLICASTTQGAAQSVQQSAPDAKLPDGFVVTPARPIRPLPRFEFDYRAPNSGTLDAPSEPNSQPRGGCRYEERKLELLV
jgi:hypothetical protein